MNERDAELVRSHPASRVLRAVAWKKAVAGRPAAVNIGKAPEDGKEPASIKPADLKGVG